MRPRALVSSLRLLALFSVLAIAVPHARAQLVELYGTFSPVHIANAATGANATTSFWSPGFGGGATFDVVPVGPLHLGVDVRASGSTGNSTSTLGLAGLKLSAHIPLFKLRPYVQGSGGYLGTKVPVLNNVPAGASLTAHYAAYEILGGIDDPVAPFISLRLIEIGGGQGRYLTGSPGTGGNVSLFTINTGVVVHF